MTHHPLTTTGTACHCQRCGNFIGHSPGVPILKEIVKKCPPEPDGLDDKYCRQCRMFNRLEIRKVLRKVAA